MKLRSKGVVNMVSNVQGRVNNKIVSVSVNTLFLYSDWV